MIAYKVVRKVSNCDSTPFKSAFYNGTQYQVGAATTPRHGNGPLAAFAQWEDAQIFCQGRAHDTALRIFKAEVVIDVDNQELWIIDYGKMWANEGLWHGLPQGTIFCKSITLLEEINDSL